MFETGLDYEAYEIEYEEVLAFADEEGNFFDLYEGDYDETGYNPYTGCYDFDCWTHAPYKNPGKSRGFCFSERLVRDCLKDRTSRVYDSSNCTKFSAKNEIFLCNFTNAQNWQL